MATVSPVELANGSFRTHGFDVIARQKCGWWYRPVEDLALMRACGLVGNMRFPGYSENPGDADGAHCPPRRLPFTYVHR